MKTLHRTMTCLLLTGGCAVEVVDTQDEAALHLATHSAELTADGAKHTSWELARIADAVYEDGEDDAAHEHEQGAEDAAARQAILDEVAATERLYRFGLQATKIGEPIQLPLGQSLHCKADWEAMVSAGADASAPVVLSFAGSDFPSFSLRHGFEGDVCDFYAGSLFELKPVGGTLPLQGRCSQNSCRVHEGVLAYANAFWNSAQGQDVLAKVRELGANRRLIITGHSFGGAVAQVVAASLQAQSNAQIASHQGGIAYRRQAIAGLNTRIRQLSADLSFYRSRSSWFIVGIRYRNLAQQTQAQLNSLLRQRSNHYRAIQGHQRATAAVVNVSHVMTFGSQMVGDAGWKATYDSLALGTRTTHFANDGDPLPRYPLDPWHPCPSFFGAAPIIGGAGENACNTLTTTDHEDAPADRAAYVSTGSMIMLQEDGMQFIPDFTAVNPYTKGLSIRTYHDLGLYTERLEEDCDANGTCTVGF